MIAQTYRPEKIMSSRPIALVTGGARGIGAAIAKRDIGAGLHDVIILNFDDSPTDKIHKLLDMSKGSIVYVPLQKK